jgi:uncharacterized protein (DUF2062 family)
LADEHDVGTDLVESSAIGSRGRVREFLNLRFVAPVRSLLAQGLAPDRLALTIAVGVVLAAFPVFGATTILCTGFALAFRLNMPVIQTINYFGAPIQLACVLPLMRLGARIFGGADPHLTLSEIVSLVRHEPRRAIDVLWVGTWNAIGAWTLLAPLVGATLFFVLKPALEHAARRMRKSRPAAPADAK